MLKRILKERFLILIIGKPIAEEVYRGDKFIKIGIYGRKEYPNLYAGFFDKIRNLFTGFGGIIEISKIQWKRLANGLLEIIKASYFRL